MLHFQSCVLAGKAKQRLVNSAIESNVKLLTIQQ